jgi:hypothetical protein
MSSPMHRSAARLPRLAEVTSRFRPFDRHPSRSRTSTSTIGGKRGAAKILPSNVPLPAQATIYEPFVSTAAFASDCLLLALESSYSFQQHEQEWQINFSPGWALGIRQNQCGQIQFS